MTKMIKPKCLKDGDKIGAFAPASLFKMKEARHGMRYFKRNHSIDILEYKSPFLKNHFIARTDEERVKEFNSFVSRKELKALIAYRGGYGTSRIIEKLDIQKLLRNPKLVIGYSDLTILLNELVKNGLCCVHGPMLTGSFFKRVPLEIEKRSFESCLFSTDPIGTVGKKEGIKCLVKGESEGILAGGNLCTLASSIGTRYEFDSKGKILFLEDIGEKPYRIDRLLVQLRDSGKFNKCKGIIFGDFVNCDQFQRPKIEAVIKDAMKDIKIPVITGFPSGHGSRQCFLPFGTKVQVMANPRDPHVRFLESCVS